MSHFLTIPTGGDGIITDSRIEQEIAVAANPPFAFIDFFLYSHGWWTAAGTAMSDYNRFSIGLAKEVLTPRDAQSSSMALALHWPSMVSDDARSIGNLLEPLSFFQMEARADHVGQHAGYSLVRLLQKYWPNAPILNLHLLGHSFGCRVVLSALNELVRDPQTLEPLRRMTRIDVVLLQAAADSDSLSQTGSYSSILQAQLPNLRMLVTVSANDKALGSLYPKAHAACHFFARAQTAMGATGPLGAPAPGDLVSVNVDVGNVAAFPRASRFVVADLTPLHKTRCQNGTDESDEFGGQHKDIFIDEIYKLIATFV